MKKSAFTLIELLVYMVIMSFIIVVAGRVFSDSTVMRVRSQSMVKTSEDVGKVSSLLREDISQMGAKSWGQNASDGYTIFNVGATNPKVYWAAAATAGDSSSYALFHRPGTTTGTFADSIIFRKAAFDNNGLFLGIREIALAARASTRQLVRRCATVQNDCPPNVTCGTTDSDLAVCPPATDISVSGVTAVVLAENIMNFNIIPALPGMAGNTQDTLFGKAADPNFKLLSRDMGSDIIDIPNTNINNEGTVTTVSNFAQNAAQASKSRNELYLTDENGNAWNVCKQLAFKKGETYIIEFKMPFAQPTSGATDEQQVLNSTQFVPGKDHLAIGLRTYLGASIAGATNDILFYPAQSAEAANLKRRAEFSMSADNNACVAITIAYYSPNVATGQFKSSEGKLKFSDFKVFRKSDETFHFLRDGDTGYDANYGTEAITSVPDKIKQKINAKAFEFILEIENKGEKSGTFSIDVNRKKRGMVITTPNNGVIAN